MSVSREYMGKFAMFDQNRRLSRKRHLIDPLTGSHRSPIESMSVSLTLSDPEMQNAMYHFGLQPSSSFIVEQIFVFSEYKLPIHSNKAKLLEPASMNGLHKLTGLG